MQTYHLKLESQPSESFRCQMAANSLDIDVKKKLTHEISVQADLEGDFNVGLILGASGSGKTTLAKKIFGDDCFKVSIDKEKPIIDQLPPELNYDACAAVLAGIGLTAVPCWIRPVKTLSNGQMARAEAALAMMSDEPTVIVDEWTSVVDRTVGKVMSHCVQKFARQNKKRIILLSCHYDVIEWLNPDWVIDCNTQTFNDRRLLQPGDRARKEQISFDIREVSKHAWPYFSKYHYLSDRLPGGKNYLFGLFQGENQIGFQCFSNYVPNREGTIPIFHSNRTVIHPDYAGFGLGIRLINETSKFMKEHYGFRIMAKFSSIPIYRSMAKNSAWRLLNVDRPIGKMKPRKSSFGRSQSVKTDGGFRTNVKTFSFEYIG